MSSAAVYVESPIRSGLLVDTSLLVLFTVGTVNRDRIDMFKRTSRYTKSDFDLLLRVLGKFTKLYTVAHVLAEVSNLTDLAGAEGQQARRVLRNTISLLNEVEMSSARSAEDRHYQKLGLVDAAISSGANAQPHCADG